MYRVLLSNLLNIFQTWTLTVAEEERINITFLHFHVESHSMCSYDWFEIYDDKYCGEIETPWTIITNSSTVDIRFTTDNIVTRSGFLAVWSPTITEGPPPPILESNIIQSPNYPQKYPNNADEVKVRNRVYT